MLSGRSNLLKIFFSEYLGYYSLLITLMFPSQIFAEYVKQGSSSINSESWSYLPIWTMVHYTDGEKHSLKVYKKERKKNAAKKYITRLDVTVPNDRIFIYFQGWNEGCHWIKENKVWRDNQLLVAISNKKWKPVQAWFMDPKLEQFTKVDVSNIECRDSNPSPY